MEREGGREGGKERGREGVARGEREYREKGGSEGRREGGKKRKGDNSTLIYCTAGNGTWEHLVHHLEQKLQVTEESFMDLAELESLNLSSGDVVLQIVQEWARREEVTLSHFCNVSRELGNSRVQGILSEMEQADIDRKLPAFVQQSPRNSRVTSI